MSSDDFWLFIGLGLMVAGWFLLGKWEEKRRARREEESDLAWKMGRHSLDYFLERRALFRDRLRRYRGVPNVPAENDAYIVLYLDDQLFQKLAKLGEGEPMAIRLRLSFLDYLQALEDDLGWIGFCKTDDDWAASRAAKKELRAAEDLILTLLGGECRELISKAKSAGFSYFNEDGTFKSENTLNLPPVTPP